MWVRKVLHQSHEKDQETMKMVHSLLDAKFIFKVKYVECILNVVLVKKDLGKWRMCIIYIDLNQACSKDSHLVPNLGIIF